MPGFRYSSIYVDIWCSHKEEDTELTITSYRNSKTKKEGSEIYPGIYDYSIILLKNIFNLLILHNIPHIQIH